MPETTNDELQFGSEEWKKRFEETRIRLRAEEQLDLEKYQNWWSNLPETRREEYLKLRTWDSDSKGNIESHIQRCRNVLELISTMESEDHRKIIPLGLAIHGSVPVVFIEPQGHEKPKWESKDEIGQYIDYKTDTPKFESDINTSEYGLPAKRREGMRVEYEIDIDEANKRLEGII